MTFQAYTGSPGGRPFRAFLGEPPAFCLGGCPRGPPVSSSAHGSEVRKMESSSQEEREVRAARNQSLFRAVNEKLETLNEAFENLTGSGTIACECADITCVEMLDVEPREYDAVRAEPRHFIVVSGHVYPDVERVVRQFSPREGSPQPARTSTLAALPILRPALETSITLTLTFHIVRSR